MNDYETNDRREQRQQPRFNRREFLAQQQANQEVPLTTSREERAAYQPQTERPRHQPREDRPQRPHRDPDMTLGEFKEKLAEIKWLFVTPNEEQSFYSVVESMEQQIKLYNMARRLTPGHLKAFVYAQQNAYQMALNNARSDALKKITEEKGATFEALEKTGDQALDSFRQRCRDHDWTWSYSDDAAVARAGQAYEDALLETVKENGGLYMAYYELCAKHFRG